MGHPWSLIRGFRRHDSPGGEHSLSPSTAWRLDDPQLPGGCQRYGGILFVMTTNDPEPSIQPQ